MEENEQWFKKKSENPEQGVKQSQRTDFMQLIVLDAEYYDAALQLIIGQLRHCRCSQGSQDHVHSKIYIMIILHVPCTGEADLRVKKVQHRVALVRLASLSAGYTSTYCI